MSWYRFWKRSGSNQALRETYRHYDVEPSEGILGGDCEDWADNIPGGHNTSYKYGHQKVDSPTLDWLQKRLKCAAILFEQSTTDIRFYEEEIARLEAEGKVEDVKFKNAEPEGGG